MVNGTLNTMNRRQRRDFPTREICIRMFVLCSIVGTSIIPFLLHTRWFPLEPHVIKGFSGAPTQERTSKQNVDAMGNLLEEVMQEEELRIRGVRTEAAQTMASDKKIAAEAITMSRQELHELKEQQLEDYVSMEKKLEDVTAEGKKMKKKIKRMTELIDKMKRDTDRKKHEKLEQVARLEEGEGFRPILVTVAHDPRNDLLGSFVLPTVYLLSIAYRYGWALEILPYEGSQGQKELEHNFGLGPKIDEGWGSGFQDATHRENYNPMKLNEVVYDRLGFFPDQPDPSPDESEWVNVENLPAPGKPGLEDLCRQNTIPGNGFLNCRLKIPIDSKIANTYMTQWHIESNGGTSAFFTESFRKKIRTRFWKANKQRLKYYSADDDSSEYHIAMHIRRGDVLNEIRWTEQSVFATVARTICKSHPGALVHIFSSGKNRDGGWEEIENIGGDCGSVLFHFDKYEFNTWAHLVAADALVISKSTFSYVPALITDGDVYYPHDFWHFPLSHWNIFQNDNGEIKK